MGRKYRPSNGTEGEYFMEAHCYQCLHERWIHRQKDDRDEDKCDILTRSMAFGIDDPEYPVEWTHDESGHATCTKFVKFDWGTDDDPHEPPDPPSPDDPRQLLMPFDFAELFDCDEVVVTRTAIVERAWLEEMQNA